MRETQERQNAKGGEIRKRMVKEIQNRFRAPSLFVTRFRGLSSKDLDELRQKLRPLSCQYFVTKNRLSCLALKSLGLDELIPWVTDQTGFVIGQEDPITLSKALVGYAKDHEALKLCGGVIGGETLTGDRLREFARLVSRDALIGKTVFLMKSPLTGLGSVLSGTVRKLLYALQEISKKMEGKGNS